MYFLYFSCTFSVAFLLTESKSNRLKICVKPAPLSDQRKSTFYRMSNTASSSLSSSVGPAAERFHCDVAAMRDTSDAGGFMFDFSTDIAGGRTDSEIDNSTTSNTDSDTTSETNKHTNSMTANNDSKMDNTLCRKDVTAVTGDLKPTNCALNFSQSAEGTTFLFNFDTS